MIIYNPLGRLERNALFFHYCQHLFGMLLIFGAYPVYEIYMREVRRIAKELGIIVINFTICPSHPHLILKAYDAELVRIFVKRLNTSFANILRSLDGGRYYSGGRLFASRPYLTPITSFRQLIECSLYVHHNNDSLFGTKMAKGGIFNSWNSSFQKYEDGTATMENDYLLHLLQMSNADYMRLFRMTREERRVILDKLEAVQDKDKENRIFKKNPDLPYCTEVKEIQFINESDLQKQEELMTPFVF
ncbi:MAG: hypothetical protein PHO44_04940 [Sphaerochaetaceae bacterium]|nr:hypothetical protein [Sphaerochaetaceae bacterium]